MQAHTHIRQKFGSIALTLLLISSALVGGIAAFSGSVLAAGDVTVEVNDESGAGVDGAEVTLFDGSGNEVANGTTSSGSVTFASQSDGDYYARVSADGFVGEESGTVTVSGSAATITVNLTSDSEVVNETVGISNSTLTAYGEIETSSSINTRSNTSTLEWTFYGVGSDGSETELDSTSRFVGESETVTEDYALSDSETTEYDEVRVVVRGNPDHVNSSDVGATADVGGGGGSSSPINSITSITILGVPVVFVLIVGGIGYVLIREDE